MLKVILRAVALILLAASIMLPLAGCKSKHYHYDRGPRYAPAPPRRYNLLRRPKNITSLRLPGSSTSPHLPGAEKTFQKPSVFDRRFFCCPKITFDAPNWHSLCVSVAQMRDNLAQRGCEKTFTKKLARFLLFMEGENNFCNERRSGFL